MFYEFSILEKNQGKYKVNICIKDESKNIIFKGIAVANYDKNIGMVLLDQNYIKNAIQNEVIRLDLISKLKRYIKSII
ncbi:hypothetical protein [Clostridium beijerinckii]|uniref:hypothetical protein n=1 Tax=Clostridium beijerinckii TaxID=1520 RepID=UPI00098C6C06|nr:hypothetical protein [Clostridium beijerinckii]NRT77617.1 hypothetical protein [Clostridium beijerinckii]OOM50481.1 hypothetical protein CBEIJ_04510 [Clostridium beijerinckii]